MHGNSAWANEIEQVTSVAGPLIGPRDHWAPSAAVLRGDTETVHQQNKTCKLLPE
jgi:hypothetical protein